MRAVFLFAILLLSGHGARGAGDPAKPVQEAGIRLTTPQEWQVVQRHSLDEGNLAITGACTFDCDSVGVRVAGGRTKDGQEYHGNWQQAAIDSNKKEFAVTLRVPAGGWYAVEARAMKGGDVVGGTKVDHVGVGEVFVVAGQSNSANWGEERLVPASGMVVNFTGTNWQPASDPQPGAGGGGGSFIPPFGDAIAARFKVPVGVVTCGIGATSVRHWLPKGARFPHPPVIRNNVTRLADGSWESDGTAFDMFVSRMKPFGPNGFRAVLWHQGESDANQPEPLSSLNGRDYRKYLEQIIRESRKRIGWDAPWFVALVSYHVPGDEACPEIRAGQKSLWDDKVALEGPDTDALKGGFREANGQGVHFSGKGLREHGARWAEKVGGWLAEIAAESQK